MRKIVVETKKLKEVVNITGHLPAHVVASLQREILIDYKEKPRWEK